MKYNIGNGVAKELICMTHGHEQWWGDGLREWQGSVAGARGGNPDNCNSMIRIIA